MPRRGQMPSFFQVGDRVQGTDKLLREGYGVVRDIAYSQGRETYVIAVDWDSGSSFTYTEDEDAIELAQDRQKKLFSTREYEWRPGDHVVLKEFVNGPIGTVTEVYNSIDGFDSVRVQWEENTHGFTQGSYYEDVIQPYEEQQLQWHNIGSVTKYAVSLPAEYTDDDPFGVKHKKPVFDRMQVDWWNLPPAEQKNAIVNAFRATMLSPRMKLKDNAILYQLLMTIDSEESDPDVFESRVRDIKAQWDAQGQADLFAETPEVVQHEDIIPGKRFQPGFWGNIRRLAALGPYAEDLRQIALADVEDGGHGRHFRENVLALGIPGVGPKVASFAWLALNPTMSDLATIDVWMMKHLEEKDESPRNVKHYYELEDRLRQEKDMLYGPDVPLGQYQWGVWDKLRTPGYHQDHAPLRVHEPVPYKDVQWEQAVRAPRPQRLPSLPEGQMAFARTATVFHPGDVVRAVDVSPTFDGETGVIQQVGPVEADGLQKLYIIWDNPELRHPNPTMSWSHYFEMIEQPKQEGLFSSWKLADVPDWENERVVDEGDLYGIMDRVIMHPNLDFFNRDEALALEGQIGIVVRGRGDNRGYYTVACKGVTGGVAYFREEDLEPVESQDSLFPITDNIRGGRIAAPFDAPVVNPANYDYVPLSTQELEIAYREMSETNRKYFRQKARDMNQRAKKHNKPGRVTAQELAAMYRRYQGKCAYDGGPGATSWDHVVPLHMGGDNTIDNLLPVHSECNRQMNEWDKSLRDNTYWHGVKPGENPLMDRDPFESFGKTAVVVKKNFEPTYVDPTNDQWMPGYYVIPQRTLYLGPMGTHHMDLSSHLTKEEFNWQDYFKVNIISEGSNAGIWLVEDVWEDNPDGGLPMKPEDIPADVIEELKSLMPGLDVLWVDYESGQRQVVAADILRFPLKGRQYHRDQIGDIVTIIDYDDKAIYYTNVLAEHMRAQYVMPIHQFQDMLRGGHWTPVHTQPKTSASEDFMPFFEDAARGLHAPQKSLEQSYQDPLQQSFHDAYRGYAGDFDAHIETSIPGYREMMTMKGAALAKAFPGASVMDIAGTGSWGKAVTTLGGNPSTTVEPNAAMIDTFNQTPVPGAELAPAAFGESFEWDGQTVPKFEPEGQFDIINESMAFQFISPDRPGQVAEVKRLLRRGGLFLTDEKVITEQWAENEAVKDEWKQQFFTPEQLAEKQQIVNVQDEESSVGMVSNMVRQEDLEAILRQSFRQVTPYWQSGNFVGYACSDEPTIVDRFLVAYNGHGLTAKVGMAERTGDPELDEALAAFEQAGIFWLENEAGEWAPDPEEEWPLESLRGNGWGSCDDAACSLAHFLNERGIAAKLTYEAGLDGKFDEGIRQMYPDAQYDSTNTPGHTAVVVERPSGRYMIDYAAGQFGYSEFPMVQRLDGDQWQRQWTSGWKIADYNNVLRAYDGERLEGYPGPVNVPGYGQLDFGAHSELQQLSQQYVEQTGLGSAAPRQYVPADPNRMAEIAQAFDQAEHNPADPNVQASYDAFHKETLAQYEMLVQNGYTFEFYPEDHDPYPAGPREAMLDLYENKHLYVFPTYAGHGTEGVTQVFDDHPSLGDSGVRWNGKPVTWNDLFRGVHDVFGHTKEGVGFRADGEDNAWRQHSAMYSDLARPAMTTETRGQNSWVNFGPYGEVNQNANQEGTVYPDQKAIILPEWAYNDLQTFSKVAMPYVDNVWYHVTDRTRLSMIATQGLVGSEQGTTRTWDDFPVEQGAVYLWPNVNLAWSYKDMLGSATQYQRQRLSDPVILRVSGIDRRQIAPDHEHMDNYLEGLRERVNDWKANPDAMEDNGEWDMTVQNWIETWQADHPMPDDGYGHGDYRHFQRYIQMLREMPAEWREEIARQISEWSGDPVMHYGPISQDKIEVGSINLLDENGEYQDRFLEENPEWAENEPEDPNEQDAWLEQRDQAMDEWMAQSGPWVYQDETEDWGMHGLDSPEDDSNTESFRWVPIQEAVQVGQQNVWQPASM